MSMHFTISKRMNERILRLQWVRMPLKTDFISTLITLGRLPAKNQTEELLEDLQELNELQYLERRPSNRHRKEIQKEYQRRVENYERDSKIVHQEMEDMELQKLAVYQKSIDVSRLQVNVMQLISRFIATNRISVMSYNAPVFSNTKRTLKFSPFSMELPQPGAITSMFNTVSPTSKITTPCGIIATGTSSGSASSMMANSIPNSPTSHISVSLVLQAMHSNAKTNSPITPIDLRSPFTSKPTIDSLQPYMRMPVAVRQAHGARNENNSLSPSTERSNSGSQPRVMGYKNGSPTSALPQRSQTVG